MTAPEYIQLRAFARFDGLKLFGLWLASFACYVAGLKWAGMGTLAMLLALFTPFLVARLLRNFRDDGLDGAISFGRGWAYVVFLFFYASLLFAVAQYAYFAYLDKGFFISTLTQQFNSPETKEAMKQMGMSETLNETMQLLRTMRPIDLVLNIMTSNLLIGIVLGLPIAAFGKRERIEKVK